MALVYVRDEASIQGCLGNQLLTSANNREVLIVAAVIHSPIVVITVVDGSLTAITSQIIQPNLPGQQKARLSIRWHYRMSCVTSHLFELTTAL